MADQSTRTILGIRDVERIFQLAAARIAHSGKSLEDEFGTAASEYTAFKQQLQGKDGWLRSTGATYDNRGVRYSLKDDGTMIVEDVPATQKYDWSAVR